MTQYVSPAGAFKEVLASWVSPGAEWKRVLGRWVGVGGVWKSYAASGSVKLVPATVRGAAYDPDIPSAVLKFQPDGKVMATFSDQTVVTSQNISDWFDPETANAGAGFELMATRISGIDAGLLIGTDLGVWTSMADEISFGLHGGVVFNRPRAITLEVAIRVAGATDPIAVAQFTLSTITYGTPGGLWNKGGGIDVVSPYRFNDPRASA